MEKQLGKIRSVKFGSGGYQDAMIGITFDLGGDSWGTGDFWGYWSGKVDKYTQWTEIDRSKYLGEVVMKINNLLNEAKVDSIDKLKDKPVEVIFNDNILTSWRILKEVL